MIRERWRLVRTRRKLWKLMHPEFPSQDVLVNLQYWDKEVILYEKRFLETVPESLKIFIYRDRLAPMCRSPSTQVMYETPRVVLELFGCFRSWDE